MALWPLMDHRTTGRLIQEVVEGFPHTVQIEILALTEAHAMGLHTS